MKDWSICKNCGQEIHDLYGYRNTSAHLWYHTNRFPNGVWDGTVSGAGLCFPKSTVASVYRLQASPKGEAGTIELILSKYESTDSV